MGWAVMSELFKFFSQEWCDAALDAVNSNPAIYAGSKLLMAGRVKLVKGPMAAAVQNAKVSQSARLRHTERNPAAIGGS